MQEDKELTFDAIDTVKGCLALFNGMIKTMHVNKETMAASSKNGFTNATDAADYLVKHGVPFRDAHGIIGQLVLICIDKGIALDDLPLEEYKKISPVFEDDVYEYQHEDLCPACVRPSVLQAMKPCRKSLISTAVILKKTNLPFIQ